MVASLEELEHQYQEAQAAEGYQPLPDGNYLCEVTEAELRDNKNTPGQHLFARLQVLTGERKGASIYHRRAITEKTLPFVKADARAFALEDLGIVALADHWPSLVGREVICRLRTPKTTDGAENQNSYLFSAAPMQRRYGDRLLAMAREKGFAKESVEQMARAQYRAELRQLTTTQLKDLGNQIKAAGAVPAPTDHLPF